ncbi:DUF397 domain-containing protein [Actinomadura logoneensis]|uniref:DUF397 domain-containing protein n=1 Tax=Actinomadura logoneensis TaxID=2293572 RepID=A0A372J9M2_9ACTN|nr:DUF397 domain-containing protein [Actinomadura logoneensis]RFU36687.1 DUF397 domain-containing protein [Actinomadura logoneensis]
MTVPQAFSRVLWRKSSHSSAEGQCVEVTRTSDGLAVRDSRNPDGPRLAIRPDVWEALRREIGGRCQR